MTVFEEKLRDFVLEDIPFEDIPFEYTSPSEVKVIGNTAYGTQTIVLSFEYGYSSTLACKPAFSDVWLLPYDCMKSEIGNYVESVLHRILSKHEKIFQYL